MRIISLAVTCCRPIMRAFRDTDQSLRLAEMESLEGLDADYFAHELVFVDQVRLSSKVTKFVDLDIYYEDSRKIWSTTEFEQLVAQAKLPFIRRIIRALW